MGRYHGLLDGETACLIVPEFFAVGEAYNASYAGSVKDAEHKNCQQIAGLLARNIFII